MLSANQEAHDLKEKQEFAASLVARDDIPYLEFQQGSDGIYRVAIPRKQNVVLRLPPGRPTTAPVVYPKLQLKHRHREKLTLAERLERRLEDYRFSGRSMLLEKLELHKEEVRKLVD